MLDKSCCTGYNCKYRTKNKMNDSVHSSLFYIKTLLEAKFSPRKFTYQEIEGLLLEVFKDDIPTWYKLKWFRKE